MLNDSQSAHRIGISSAEALGLIGRIVRIDGKIKGYTFGYPLNADTFCVLFEIADLSTKGLAQFIYREFCRELMDAYKWINAMDDSGLENLKRVKHSYYPCQLLPSYNIVMTKEQKKSASPSIAPGGSTGRNFKDLTHLNEPQGTSKIWDRHLFFLMAIMIHGISVFTAGKSKGQRKTVSR